MKESQQLFKRAEIEFEKAQDSWKARELEKAEAYFYAANYGMMKAYLVSEGIMHMDTNNSIHSAFWEIWIKDSVFQDKYGHELNYLDQFYNKRGYFKEHPQLNTQLKNDFTKLYGKLQKIALLSIKKNQEDKIVSADDLVTFVSDVNNIVGSSQEVKKEKQDVEEAPKKKGFFKSLFGGIKIDIEVNGKKKNE